MNKPAWLEIAEKEIGTHEITGVDANPKIIKYHAHTTLKATSDEVAWCSAFANYCMDTAGIAGTHSAAARSWLQWGDKLDEPRMGCIVVFRRGTNPQSGHVGFFSSDVGNGYIKVLGGNQGDSVKYSNFKTSEVLGYRWPK